MRPPGDPRARPPEVAAACGERQAPVMSSRRGRKWWKIGKMEKARGIMVIYSFSPSHELFCQIGLNKTAQVHLKS